MQRFFAWYGEQCIIRPYITQSITGGVLWCAGDLISQTFEQKQTFDWVRVARMTGYGIVIAGPLYAWWYKVLDQKTLFLAQRSRVAYLLAKLGGDQVLFEPINLTIFFSITSAVQHWNKPNKLEIIQNKIQTEFVSTYVADCIVWPPAQLLNFQYVPVKYHPLVVNSICVGWNAFLAFVSNR